MLKAAVGVLIEHGLSKTTTLEVQKQAAVSRGALLHHFPTHADLLSKTVNELVTLNEQAVWTEAAKLEHLTDPIAKPIWILANAYAHPSFGAELELWVASRSDPTLRKALRAAEKDAVEDHDRVLAKLFGELPDQPGGQKVIFLTIEFVRGLAVSTLLRNDPRLRNRLIEDWIETVKNLLKSETK
ncbi:TetR/AcrR family transcriptional regulator [Labrenzia sp. PHM005]|uniref:TetR/AcrR family transcriptional regulator n=1 Tax=Labrenzia sp. PHM005 TaxID=2590016 RepID=UPI00113FC4C9|nr:TetR/AcrR family transcriptional regulator [Labrenzia sp. PHM005]QDG76169.1 TetR/AcrR family transcriptional regulator [Labrenzia sp. PHM005]